MLSLASLLTITEIINVQLIRISVHIALLHTEVSVIDRDIVTCCHPSIIRTLIEVQVADFHLCQSETITRGTSRICSLNGLR